MHSSLSDPWHVTEAGFPANGTPAEILRYALNYAVLAPSAHNSQPWRFVLEADYLRLYADRTRALPVVDPHDRELTISCGAALFLLQLALRHFGRETEVELLPDADDPDYLACIRLGKEYTPAAEDERLFWNIPNRHTNRMSFREEKVPNNVLDAIRAAAEQESVWIHVVGEGKTRSRLAELIVAADSAQLADPQYRRELAEWVRSNHDTREDGMPGYVFGISGLVSYAGPFLIRTFDTGAITAARDRQLAIGAPVLIVIGTKTDTPRDWLLAGQAITHLLLHATAEGISASFLNPPVQAAALRPKVAESLGGAGFPQLILRMGYGPDIQPTPRRAAFEVVETEMRS